MILKLQIKPVAYIFLCFYYKKEMVLMSATASCPVSPDSQVGFHIWTKYEGHNSAWASGGQALPMPSIVSST